MIKILHTADIHLGRPFRDFGGFGERLRKARMDTFANIVDLALAENVDAVIIAGDLYDNARVTSATMTFVKNQLSRLSPKPVFILPGTHDSLQKNPILQFEEFVALNHVKIFTSEEIETHFLTNGKVAFHGRGKAENLPTLSPLLGIRPAPSVEYNVAIAHGAIRIPGQYNLKEPSIDFDDIEKSGMDYIALGHWHKCADYSRDKTKVFYSGTPETLKFDEAGDSGYVLVVTLDKNKPKIDKRKVGQYDWLELQFDMGAPDSFERMRNLAIQKANDKRLLKLKLKGFVDQEYLEECQGLSEKIGSHFAFLEVDLSDLHPKMPSNAADVFPIGTIGYHFTELMKGKVAESSDAVDRQLIEDAYQLGLGYLTKKVRVAK